MGDLIRFSPRLRLVPHGHDVHDPLVRWMKAHNVPLTRDNYIDLATNGGELEWVSEHDANLPLHELIDD